MAKKSASYFSLDRILLVLGGAATVFMFILLIAFFVGGPFEGLLRGMGLEIKEFRGVFIDCSKPGNRNHSFCKELKQHRAPKKEPESLYEKDPTSLPFNLN